ncbi:unnamed protein product [Coffea canephora]|uniref:FHA domain-containing protein n=1 Tax=Coffea canephora TaxID=49390 RepID=A0A068UFV1_COFCA|nr:unnamed protein product [Coffea canephora]
MGALAPVATHWLPQDDLLLKNAVEAGASLESLAKGAVQFSHRFTVQELQDRWHTLLYDPVVSFEASVRMIEFEQSAPMAQSKLIRIDNNKEAKCISRKRKAETVRKCYYAMRKRICNESFDSIDLIFLDESSYGDVGNGNGPTSNGFLLGDQISKYFGNQELNFGAIDHSLGKLGVNEGGSCGDGLSAAACCTGLNDHHRFSPGQGNQPQNLCPPFDENLSLTGDHISINEYGPSQELQACNLLQSLNVVEKPQNMFGQSVDKEGNACSGSTCQHLLALVNILAPNAEEYFEQLSNSLLNFTSEDEQLFMDADADGKDIIDKSYIENLSSLLLDFPDGSDVPSLGLSEASVAPQECLNISNAVYHGQECLDIPNSGENEQYDCGDGRQVWSVEAQKLSSALTVNPIFPELRNGVICCTLNTEDTEIPNNDDVFLPIWMPCSSISLITNAKSDEAYYPMTSSVNDFSHGEKATAGVMVKCEPRSTSKVHVPPQESRFPSEMGHNHQFNDDGLRFELPCSDVPHVALKKTGGSECPNGANIKHLSNKDIINESLNNSLMKQQEGDCISPVQISDDIHAELYSIGQTIPNQAVNCTLSDEEEFSCESDDDVPYFSDVEAMILDMDLSPDDQDVYHSPRVLRYQHEDARKTIIRLEQAADACVQRCIAAQGALAVLYGHRSRHFIKKPEVLLGRGTKDFKVDIDLGREACANKISRRQATLKMEIDGSFLLKNHGKCPTFVNGKEVLPGHNVNLISGCLIEMGRITFVFETNRTLRKAYRDNICGMKPDLGSQDMD